jgi:glucuronate isomerase
LKEADVWNWEAEYLEPNLAVGQVDGTVWRLYIKQGGREKKIVGSNRYPASEKFKKYLEAIQLLIGNNRFQ